MNMRMKSMVALAAAVMLFVMAVPAVVSAATELPDGANIWIAVSPTESHPSAVDRPGAVIPLIDSYRVRVAVYGDPYTYTNEAGEEVTVDILGYNISLKNDLGKADATLSAKGADRGVAPIEIHQESDDKWTYVFLMGDLIAEGGVTRQTTQLEFKAGNYTGISDVKIKGGGGGTPTDKGGGKEGKGGSGGPPTDKPGKGGNGGKGGR